MQFTETNKRDISNQRATAWIAGLFAQVFCGLSILSLIVVDSALATDQSRKVEFDGSLARVSESARSFEFAGFQSMEMAELTISATPMIFPLVSQSGVSDPPQVLISGGGRTLVGFVDLHSGSAFDFPTADHERYLDIQPSVSQLFETGWRPWSDARVITGPSGAYIEALISPFEIDSSGAVYLLSELLVTTSGGSAHTIAEPVIDADAQEYLREQSRNSDYGGTSLRYSSALVDFLIITNSALQREMERLAAYRRATGTETEVVLIDEILAAFSGVDEAARLREYLKTRFATGVRYVLLAGDETVVPIRYAYYYNTSSQPPVENLMICDLYFADLNGDWDFDGDGVWGEPTHDLPDLTPELYIGRLPISESWQAKNYVDKLILYETDPGFGDRSYLTRSAIFSSDQMRDFADGGQHAALANAMPANISIDTSGLIETPNGSDPAPFNLTGAESIEKLSEGYGIVNIIAHGRHDGFAVRTANYNEWPKSYLLATDGAGSHGSLDSLAPNGYVGLYVALSCDLGGFDMDSPPFVTTSMSFVESVVSTESSGAVGMIAYSRWGWVYSSYHLHREFLKQLAGAAGGSPVEAMYASSALYPYYRDLIYGQNYVGDPTVRIHMAAPAKYDLAVTTSYWADGVIHSTLSHNGSAISGVRVLLSENGTVIAETLTGADGAFNFFAEFALGVEYTVSALPGNALVSLASFTPAIATDAEVDVDPILPLQFALHQNYPNPFNPTTVISWDLPQREDVALIIYDMLGRRVEEITFGEQSAGSHQFDWNLKAENGQSLASGVYLYQIRAGAFTQTRKMTALK